MPDLQQRLERLHEQKIKLPAYELDHDDGVYYAIFMDPHDLMMWNELLPEYFGDFPHELCESGCCCYVELGRMH
jgi:hypothetical protein